MSGFDQWILSEHAHEELLRRGIPITLVEQVLIEPDTVIPVREGRVVVQGLIATGPMAKPYLLRVFVDIDRTPCVIVTAYRTSNLRKYQDRP